jgi:hypothetical protein
MALIFIGYLLYSINVSDIEIATFIIVSVTNIYLFLFTAIFYSKQQKLLYDSIYYALLIFTAAWFLQFIVYYATGYYIDFLKPLTGVDQRYQAYFTSSAINIIRPTSLFNEPGTYAMVTLPLLILNYLETKKLNRLHYFTLASYFLSLSLFAILEASLFIVVVMWTKIFAASQANKRKMIFLFLTVTTILFSVVGLYNSLRFNSSTNLRQVELRTNLINSWRNENEMSLLFGNGFAINETTAAATDTSLYFRTVYDYGILTIPLYILFFYISWGLPLFFTLIVFLTKVNYMHYHLWFYFAALMILYHNKNSSKD